MSSFDICDTVSHSIGLAISAMGIHAVLDLRTSQATIAQIAFLAPKYSLRSSEYLETFTDGVVYEEPNTQCFVSNLNSSSHNGFELTQVSQLTHHRNPVI